MNEPVKQESWPLETIEKAATYIAKSGLFGARRVEEAIAIMLLAQAEGLHPMRAIQEYHIINGRPALKADAMLARFQQAGGTVEWQENSETACSATFSHPQGGSVKIRWTMEDAKRAGLIGKAGGNWEKYPRAMLRSRVVSEGVRTVYPAVIVGVYTPEEVREFDVVDNKPASLGMAEQVEPVLPSQTQPTSTQPERPSKPQAEITKNQIIEISERFRKLGLERDEFRQHRAALISTITGQNYGSRKQLSYDEAQAVIHGLDQLMKIIRLSDVQGFCEALDAGVLEGQYSAEDGWVALLEDYQAIKQTQ